MQHIGSIWLIDYMTVSMMWTKFPSFPMQNYLFSSEINAHYFTPEINSLAASTADNVFMFKHGIITNVLKYTRVRSARAS